MKSHWEQFIDIYDKHHNHLIMDGKKVVIQNGLRYKVFRSSRRAKGLGVDFIYFLDGIARSERGRITFELRYEPLTKYINAHYSILDAMLIFCRYSIERLNIGIIKDEHSVTFVIEEKPQFPHDSKNYLPLITPLELYMQYKYLSKRYGKSISTGDTNPTKSDHSSSS